MLVLYSALIGYTLICFSDASFVDSLYKCSIKDDNCLRLIYEKMMKDYGKNGVPEYNLPPIDPMNVKNISVPVLEGFEFSLISGVIKGISNCTYNSFHLYVKNDKKFVSLDKTCDFTVEGKMSLSGNNTAMFGKSSLETHGLGKLTFDKFHFTYDKQVEFVRLDDGEIHWFWAGGNPKYKFDVQRVTFSGKKFLLGVADITKIIVDFFNGNWRMIVDSVGIKFLTKGVEQYFVLVNKLYEHVPTSAYVIDDLSPYL